MQEWLVSLVGEDLAPMAQWAVAALVVIILIFVVIWVAKKALGGTGGTRVKGRGPRLAVMDVAPIDQKRKLVLVRRDEVEHLLLIGGQNDVVVEASILRVPAGGRTQRAEPAMRPDGELSGRERMAAVPATPIPAPIPAAPRQGAPATRPQQAQRPATGAPGRAASPLARSVPRPAAPLPAEEPQAPAIMPVSAAPVSAADEGLLVAPAERQAPIRQMDSEIAPVIRGEADRVPEPKARRMSEELSPSDLPLQRRDPAFTDAPMPPENAAIGLEARRQPEHPSREDTEIRPDRSLDPRSPVGRSTEDAPKSGTPIAHPTSGGDGALATPYPSSAPSVAPPVFAAAPIAAPVFAASAVSPAFDRPSSPDFGSVPPRSSEMRFDDRIPVATQPGSPGASVQDASPRNRGEDVRGTLSVPQFAPVRSQPDRPAPVDSPPVRRAPQTTFQRTAIAGSDAFRRVGGSAESEGPQTAEDGAAVTGAKSAVIPSGAIPSGPSGSPSTSAVPLASRPTAGLLPTAVVPQARSMATPTIPLRVPVTEERPDREKITPPLTTPPSTTMEPSVSKSADTDEDDLSNGGFMPAAQEPSSVPEPVTAPLAPPPSPALGRAPLAVPPVIASPAPTHRMPPLASQSPLIAAAERQRDAIRSRINLTAAVPSATVSPQMPTPAQTAAPAAPSTPVTSNWNPVPASVAARQTASPVSSAVPPHVSIDEPKTPDAGTAAERETSTDKQPLSVRSFATAIQAMKPSYEPTQRAALEVEPQERQTAEQPVDAAAAAPKASPAGADAGPTVASSLARAEPVSAVEDAPKRRETTESAQTDSLEDFLSAELDSDFGNVRWDDDEAGRTTPSVEAAGEKKAEVVEAPTAADAETADEPVQEPPKRALTLEEEMERLLGDFDFVTSDRKSN